MSPASGRGYSPPNARRGHQSIRRLKILLLYEIIYPDSIGGVEARNHELARALAARGHEVTLAGFCSSATAPPAGVRLLPLGPRLALYSRDGRRSVGHATRFAAAVARLDAGAYDIVETASVPFAHLIPLALRCSAAGTPLFVTWYEFWGDYWRAYSGSRLGLLYRVVERLSARVGTRALFTSDLTGDRLRRARPRGRIEPLACGVDAERVRRAEGRAAATGPPLVFVGRLIEHKRLDLLLRAVAKLAPEHPGPLLTILGDGPDGRRLGRFAGELGLSDRVRFVDRVETSDDVFDLLAASRIAVQPSAREGFGLFPLEALAMGLPVVFCDSPESAVGELVRDGVEGICVPAEPDTLARVLAGLLASPAERARFGANGRIRAEGFDWTKIAERFEALAGDVIHPA